MGAYGPEISESALQDEAAAQAFVDILIPLLADTTLAASEKVARIVEMAQQV